MRDMAGCAISICDRVVGRLTRALLMTTDAIECAGIGQLRHILAVESAMALNAIPAGNGLMHAGGIKMDVTMAFDAGLSHGRIGDIRLMRRMAGAA